MAPRSTHQGGGGIQATTRKHCRLQITETNHNPSHRRPRNEIEVPFATKGPYFKDTPKEPDEIYVTYQPSCPAQAPHKPKTTRKKSDSTQNGEGSSNGITLDTAFLERVQGVHATLSLRSGGSQLQAQRTAGQGRVHLGHRAHANVLRSKGDHHHQPWGRKTAVREGEGGKYGGVRLYANDT